MNRLKEFLQLTFYSISILLIFSILVGIGTDIYKNIKIANKVKDVSICIKVDNELYCRLDYDINIQKA